MNGYTIDLTPIIELIASLVMMMITAYVIPWIKANTDEKEEAYVKAAVHVAVYAAEKFWGAGHGDEKLEYALKVLRDEYGLEVNAEKIRTVIDAEIKEMEMLEPKIIDTGWIETGKAETAEG